MKTIIVATHNEGKVREFRALFQEFGMTVQSLKDLDYHDEVEETGSTFSENARLKAETISEQFDKLVVADDSGLVVDALNGEPGVYSARYAGEGKNDNANIEKVLRKMENVENEKRTAKFVCVLAVAIPGKPTRTIEGTCKGVITRHPTGDHGFGYDPIFYVPSMLKTLAQLTPEEKNQISHRANALKQLKVQWDEILKNQPLNNRGGRL